MGKAKRFNVYDSIVAEARKATQSYGQARQDRAFSGSSFRNMPGQPPIARTAATTTGGTGTGTFLTASLSADQTTNIAATDHVEFDTKDEDGNIVLQTGAGQADGIFELGSGKKYELSGMLRPEFSGVTGQLVIAWFDKTNAAEIGSRAIYEAQTNTSNNANQPVAEAIVTPDANITVELRIISVTALTALANEYCIANLFEIALGGTGVGGGGGGGAGVTFPLNPDVKIFGSVSGAQTINLSLSDSHYSTITLTGDVTFTFSNPPASGKEMSFVIDILQDGIGGHTITWPGSVRSDPAIGTGVDARTVVVGSTVDGGTNFDVLIVTGGTQAQGANKSLSNLTSVAINTTLLPNTDDSIDLGSASKEWKDLFIDGTANIDTLAATQMSGTLTMAGAAIATSGSISFNADNTHDLGTSSFRARDVFTHDLRIGSSGLGVGGSRQIYGDVGGTVINFPTGLNLTIQENAVDKVTISASNYNGNNIILSDTLTINDSSTDPSANGQFQRNGVDAKVFSGGAVRNFSDIVSGGSANTALSNLASVAVNESLISDTDDTDDLGSTSIQWKDLWIDGTANIDILSLSTTTGEGVSTTILPTTDANLDLGSSLRSWDSLFIGKLILADDQTTAGVGSADLIQMTATGMEFNLDSATDKYFWEFNGTAKFDMSQTTFTGPNIIISPGGTFTNNGNTTLGSDSSDRLSVNALIDTKLLPSDGTKDSGDSTTGWNNIFSDNTLFCSNFKVFTGDSDINVFNDLDMQAGDTIDFADISTSAGAGSRTLPSNPQDFIVIKVNGVSRRVPFYTV